MTRKRIAALQWFYDRGEVSGGDFDIPSAPSPAMVGGMLKDEQLETFVSISKSGVIQYRLTDKGRRDLHEATS